MLGLNGEKHYVKGGKPGYFPSLKSVDWPHPVPLDLWDPFGFTKKMTPERKEKALLAEINNGFTWWILFLRAEWVDSGALFSRCVCCKSVLAWRLWTLL